MGGGGADVGDACGADSGIILLANGLGRAAPLFDVATEAALKADVVRGFDVDAEVIEREEIGIIERE